MTEEQYLLKCVAEECAEVIKEICKTERFGLHDVEPGQVLTNKERVKREINDLRGALEKLADWNTTYWPNYYALNAKKRKIEKFMAYSREIGVLDKRDLEQSLSGKEGK